MSRSRFWLFLVTILGGLMLSSTATSKDYEQEAQKLFEQRLIAREIDGTGHVFSIVVECDARRLKNLADNLRSDDTLVVDYDFALEVHTKQKDKSRIVGGGLNKSVETCIVERYHRDVMFTPYAPAIMENTIRFPVVLMNGKQPLYPRTPIGFISEEGQHP